MSDSARQRVLALPELVESILSSVQDRKDLVSALTTNKQLFFVGRKVHWRALEGESDFKMLLRLLAPLQEQHETDSLVRFVRHPMPKAWEQFDGYADLIHSITLPDLHEFKAICTTIAQTRPLDSVLLRNLYYLRFSAYDVDDDLVHYVQFMVPSVIKLDFKLTGRDSFELHSSMRFFFSCISSRLNHLRSLSISLATIKSHPVSFISLLAHTLEGLKSLECVVLPPCVVVGKVITSLSHHPHLVEINPAHGSLAPVEAYSIASCFRSSPELRNLAFPSLDALSFCASPQIAHALLMNPHFPANQMSRIHVQTFSQKHRRGEPDPVEPLIQAIASNCTNIQDVTITEIRRPNPRIDLVLSYRSIHAILRCTSITSLKIEFRGCLPWTVQDVNVLASSLPAATTLLLNEAPSHPVEPALRIETALSAFSCHCPKLRQLGFYFDARSKPHFSDDQYSEDLHIPRFQSLVTLHVGLSLITSSSQNIVDVAALLIVVLPRGCKMRWTRQAASGFVVDTDDVDTDDESSVLSMEENNCAWQRVDQLRDLHGRLPSLQ
ncbi:hypothetical protein Hypma_011132 [Hypsizygus marmoreus]|uniref:F-box domain-containing protein n=1 Tax=Hypsizygus marmoreus TaxID=39966 RepID=A0A369JT30_HYPMA|nr:hypothetical protein Hypma_011132 [Hypsizygus marmoreus]